ncbi:MAG: zinc metallopeptidase [Bacillota bacterium]
MYLLYYISAILVLPAIIYSVYVSKKVNSTFQEYSRVGTSLGMSAAEVARMVLDKNGLTDVQVGHTNGNLTDHYDPRTNNVYLSDTVHNSYSVAAIGVAIHECGHAMQAQEQYIPYKMRASVFPLAKIGSQLAIPLLLVGILFDSFFYVGGETTLGYIIMIAALVLYSFSTLFTFITLPVEFNASKRAKNILSEMINQDEIEGCEKVLDAAAKTYVASFAVSLMQLLRLLFLVMSRKK